MLWLRILIMMASWTYLWRMIRLPTFFLPIAEKGDSKKSGCRRTSPTTLKGSARSGMGS